MFMVSRTNCLRGQSTAGLKVSENLTFGSVLQRNPDIQYGEAMGQGKGEGDWAVRRAAAEKCGDPAGARRVGRTAAGRLRASGSRAVPAAASALGTGPDAVGAASAVQGAAGQGMAGRRAPGEKRWQLVRW